MFCSLCLVKFEVRIVVLIKTLILLPAAHCRVVNCYRSFEDIMILIKVGKHLPVGKTEDLNLQFLFAMNPLNAASKFRTVNSI